MSFAERQLNESRHPLLSEWRMRVPRRLALFAALVTMIGCANDLPSSPPNSTGSSSVAENHLPGDADWLAPQRMRVDANGVAVWASPYSLALGESLDVFISSARGRVSVNLYRLGWYAGAGARSVWRDDTVPAQSQVPCDMPTLGPTVCHWQRTLRIPSSSNWVSGIYLIRVSDSLGFTSYYPFVVRANHQTDFVFVAAQFTWQAYNHLGASLYHTAGGPPGSYGYFVSFERPYSTGSGASLLLGSWYSHELRLLRFLERNGYDVSYVSDLDLASPSESVRPKHALLFAGHDEYWTWDEFGYVTHLRDDGVHLAFFAANDAYWNIRLAPGTVTGRSGELITCYKNANIDPEGALRGVSTVRFRDPPLNRPENALYGVMYRASGSRPYGVPIISRHISDGPAATLLAAAGLVPGDELTGAASDEGDFLYANANTPRGIQVIARGAVSNVTDQSIYNYTTFFVASSGAGVFASGNNEYASGLDAFLGTPESRSVQSLTKAVLEWMRAH